MSKSPRRDLRNKMRFRVDQLEGLRGYGVFDVAYLGVKGEKTRYRTTCRNQEEAKIFCDARVLGREIEADVVIAPSYRADEMFLISVKNIKLIEEEESGQEPRRKSRVRPRWF